MGGYANFHIDGHLEGLQAPGLVGPGPVRSRMWSSRMGTWRVSRDGASPGVRPIKYHVCTPMGIWRALGDGGARGDSSEILSLPHVPPCRYNTQNPPVWKFASPRCADPVPRRPPPHGDVYTT